MAFEAVRLATKYMTPVLLLSDSYLANGAEPWRVVVRTTCPTCAAAQFPRKADLRPYRRDPQTLARPWVAPGTPGLEHRIGGLEKQDVSGQVSYDAANHQRMVSLARGKDRRHRPRHSAGRRWSGPRQGELLVVGWGSTYGAIAAAVEELQRRDCSVAHLHLRHLQPFPAQSGEVLASIERVLVPETNLGQLRMLLTGSLPGRRRWLHGLKGGRCASANDARKKPAGETVRRHRSR